MLSRHSLLGYNRCEPVIILIGKRKICYDARRRNQLRYRQSLFRFPGKPNKDWVPIEDSEAFEAHVEMDVWIWIKPAALCPVHPRMHHILAWNFPTSCQGVKSGIISTTSEFDVGFKNCMCHAHARRIPIACMHTHGKCNFLGWPKAKGDPMQRETFHLIDSLCRLSIGQGGHQKAIVPVRATSHARLNTSLLQEVPNASI